MTIHISQKEAEILVRYFKAKLWPSEVSSNIVGLPGPGEFWEPATFSKEIIEQIMGYKLQYLLNDFLFDDDCSKELQDEVCDGYNKMYLDRFPETILIKPLNATAKQFYKSHGTFHEGDSGLDLFCLKQYDIAPGETVKIRFGIACQAAKSFWLLPRSSISKGPLRMANSMGLIDQGYRGELMAVVDHIKPEQVEHLNPHHRLFQIAFPDLTPIRPIMTEYISSTTRGTGGFGSTN